MSTDYHEILGVPKDADLEHIRTAYRSLARALHPDHAGPGATARFQRIVEAYKMLTNSSALPNLVPDQPEGPSTVRASQVMPMDASRPFITPVPMGPRGRMVANDALQAQLPISWFEARRGGSYEVRASRLERCQHCGGSGLANPGICSPCGGSGRLSATHKVTVEVPPGTPDGAVLHTEVTLASGETVWAAVQVRTL